MKIDLHIHTRTGSDGSLSVEEVVQEAYRRNLGLVSITDHDSIDAQERAIASAQEHGIAYITGIELNVTFEYRGKQLSLDFLGYCYDASNRDMKNKLRMISEYRENRARQILEKLNVEFVRENRPVFTADDMKEIRDSVDGTFGRPHIADYLIRKGIVRDRKEAFERYLVKCDVPKYPLTLAEASSMIRNANGLLVLAHPNDPQGTSLTGIRRDLHEQTGIINECMLEYIDGIECWHSRHDAMTIVHYADFARSHNLIMTGGSDCHQKPVIMGAVDVPGFVARQFAINQDKTR
jgi:predicted metal-dependent phosphoesterase TrpH